VQSLVVAPRAALHLATAEEPLCREQAGSGTTAASGVTSRGGCRRRRRAAPARVPRSAVGARI